MIKAQVLSQTFNGRVEWIVEGGYFKIVTAAANLQAELYQGGVLVLLAPTVKAGFYQRVPFDRIVLTNTGSQLTEVLIAPDEGGSDAFTGSFVISSPLLGDNADNVAAAGAGSLVGVLSRQMAWNPVTSTFDRLIATPPSSDAFSTGTKGYLATFAALYGYNGGSLDRVRADAIGGAGALRVTERGFAYGASFGSVTLQAANTALNVFTAGANPNGAIVWLADGQVSAAGVIQLSLLAKATAPTTAIDGDMIATGRTVAANQMGFHIDRPVLIPAGKGLYFFNSAAEVAPTQKGVLYTLL